MMNQINFSFVLRVHPELDGDTRYASIKPDDADRGAGHPFFSNFRRKMKEEASPDKVVLTLPTAEPGSLVLAATVTMFYDLPSAFFLALSVVNGVDWLSSHLNQTARETFGDRIRISETSVRSYRVLPDPELSREIEKLGLAKQTGYSNPMNAEPKRWITVDRILILLLFVIWFLLASAVMSKGNQTESCHNCCQISSHAPNVTPTIIKQVCIIPDLRTDESSNNETDRIKVYK